MLNGSTSKRIEPRQRAEDDSEDTIQLLNEFLAGNSDAFARLFDRHKTLITHVIHKRLDPRLLSRADSSDLLQETQVEAFRRLGDFMRRRPMPFRLWLLKTACEQIRRVERRHLETAKRSVDRQLPLPTDSSLRLVNARFESPSGPAKRRETAARVRQALARFSETDREIVLMRSFHDLNNSDVAQLLDITPEAARKRYRRALLRLQVFLKAAGEDA